MYSDIPGGTPPYEYTFTTNQCGNYNSEADCYNREHSWPASWFNDMAPTYTDLFHIVATDGYVNNRRSNYPYGEVGTATWISLNGSKLGNCATPGYSGTVFEPIDEYKGDFARNYFYIATRYYGEDAGWPGSDMVTGSQFKPWARAMLLVWAQQDPVSQKETDRNNAVYAIQQNRNPFIDHPEYANSIWGINTGLADAPARIALQVFPNPVSQSCTITLPPDFSQQNVTFTVYSSTGRQVNVPFSVSGDKASADFKNLPSGIYLLQFSPDDHHTLYQARIIKK
jgi:endonuclease I